MTTAVAAADGARRSVVRRSRGGWAPNGVCLASGGMDAEVRIWDAATGKQRGKPLKGHKKWITALVWEPMTTYVGAAHAPLRIAPTALDLTLSLSPLRF